MKQPANTISISQPTTDWIALSKTIAIELGFLASLVAIVTGHGTPDVVSICLGSGATLGLLRIADVTANAVNVRSYLMNPSAGVVPQSTNTPLVTTSSVKNGGG